MAADRLKMEYLFAVAISAALATGVSALFPGIFWIVNWLPREAVRWLLLYAPFVTFGVWILTLIVAPVIHRWRGLWLLPTAAIAVPALFAHLLVYACAVHQECL